MSIFGGATATQLLFPTSAISGDFPVSSKGIQATIVATAGIDSSKALAIGQVQLSNLGEYCSRDPGGMTIKYGGTLSYDQCIERIRQEVGGRKYSSSADCPRKLVTVHWGPTYVLASKSFDHGFRSYSWRDKHSGSVLDG